MLSPSFSNGNLSGIGGFVEASGKRYDIHIAASSFLAAAAPAAPPADLRCNDGILSEGQLFLVYGALKVELVARRIPLNI